MSKDRVRFARIAAEGVAIVLSILAAFAIDAWWDVSQEARRVHGVLAGLETELSESIEQIEQNLATSQEDGERLRRFLSESPAQAREIAFDSTFLALQAIWRPNTEENNTTFVLSTLDDPGIKALQNAELARVSAAWRVRVSELEERDAQLASLEVDVLRALGRHPEVAQMLLGNPQASRGGVPGVTGEVMARVRQDPEVVALGASKSLQQRVQRLTLELLRVESDSLRSLVRAAMER